MKKKAIVSLIILTISSSVYAQCRNVDLNDLTARLKTLVEATISIKLDKDDSQISILGVNQRFSIPTENISKKGRDWRYYVNDLRSDDSNLYWGGDSRRYFILDVRFEGQGSEIKGTCPGCLRRFRDSRAPDLNWKGARIARIHFRPIPFEGSVTIEITNVELFGEFDLNGILDYLFPRMVRNMENKIKTLVERNAMIILNRTDIRRNIANNIRPVLRSMGISRVNRIRLSPDGRNVQFCQ